MSLSSRGRLSQDRGCSAERTHGQRHSLKGGEGGDSVTKEPATICPVFEFVSHTHTVSEIKRVPP